MESNIYLRESLPTDLLTLASLCTELGYPTSTEDMTARTAEISLQPNSKTVVAEVNNQIVGFMGITKCLSWEQNGCFVRIQALVVSEQYRKLGIGKSLIDYAESWAKEMDAKHLVLNCGNRPERDSAHKFYSKIGFEAKSMGYKRELP
jgi:GNAT superfamily N-acetyltransferase